MRHIEELSQDVFQQLEDLAHSCTFFSIALDKSTDISDVAQLNIFIRGIDDNINLLSYSFPSCKRSRFYAYLYLPTPNHECKMV